MKILIVTTEIGLEGGGLSLSCKRLANIISNNNSVEIVNSAVAPVQTISGGFFPQTCNYIQRELKLKTEAKKYQEIDIVIGFGGKFNGYYAALLAKQIKAKYILCLRGSDVNLAKWSVEDSWYLHEASQYAVRIVCLTEEMRQNVLLADHFSGNKLIIIPNPLDGEYLGVSFPHLPSSVVIGCAASHLNEKKGITNLLYMVSEFKKISELSIKLIIVGDIDSDLKQGYWNIINKLSLHENVCFYNKTSRTELIQIMKNWDFYVQGSVCEGHPNAIVEALQNGCAFISTNTGYIAEMLSPEHPEIFFQDWIPINMAKSLKKLVSEKNKDYIYAEVYKKLLLNCNKQQIEKEWKQLFGCKKENTNKYNIEHIIAVGLHDVQGDKHDSITTPTHVFQEFVGQINLLGYGLCSMRDYLAKNAEERQSWIVCTFDDGYSGLIDNALPILSQYGFTATVFVCTDLIGKDNKWNNKDAVLRRHLNMVELRLLYKNGWEIASHGVSHNNLLKLTDIELGYELKHSHDFIVKEWGEAITYAYPYGAYNTFIKNCVGKYYKYAFSVTQGGTSLIADSLQIRRYSITEIYKMLSNTLEKHSL